VESNSLYDLLEKEVVPLFYHREADGLPRGWISRMKTAMQAICPFFNSHRMVTDYVGKHYMPAIAEYAALTADDLAQAKRLAQWKAQIAKYWPRVKIASVELEGTFEYRVGQDLEVRAQVYLASLDSQDVKVQLYYGQLDSKGEIIEAQVADMKVAGAMGDGSYRFVGEVSCRTSGRYGYAVRVLPYNEALSTPFVPGYILWAAK